MAVHYAIGLPSKKYWTLLGPLPRKFFDRINDRAKSPQKADWQLNQRPLRSRSCPYWRMGSVRRSRMSALQSVLSLACARSTLAAAGSSPGRSRCPVTGPKPARFVPASAGRFGGRDGQSWISIGMAEQSEQNLRTEGRGHTFVAHQVE